MDDPLRCILYSTDDSHNIIGTWSQVHHGEYSVPDLVNKEATVDGVFYSDEVRK